MLIGFDASRAFTKENTGTENYSLNLLKALAKIDRKNNYRVYLRGTSDKLQVTSRIAKQFPKNFQFKVIAPNYLWTQLGLALETWKSPVDVLFVPAHTLPIFRNYRVRTVVTMHDLGVEYLPGYHKFPERYYLDFASKFAARHADCLIAVSNTTKRDLIRRYGVSAGRIKVVYEGVDMEFFKPQSKLKIESVKKKYMTGKNYFLYVGTVQPRKNLMFLIDIFNTFVKRDIMKANISKDIETTLVIAGKMGWDFLPIKGRVKALGLGKMVKFLGYVPKSDLPALYSGASIFVFPSLFEGFGLPILESLACGCPVVASDIGPHRELFSILTRVKTPASKQVDTFTRGYNIGKPHVKATKIGNLHKNEAMVLAKVNNGRQWLELLDQTYQEIYQTKAVVRKALTDHKIFSWEQVAKETLKVLNSVRR